MKKTECSPEGKLNSVSASLIKLSFYTSSPRPFWPQGPVSWKTVFPRMWVWGWGGWSGGSEGNGEPPAVWPGFLTGCGPVGLGTRALHNHLEYSKCKKTVSIT